MANLLLCVPGEFPEPEEGAVAPERVVRQGEEAQLAQRQVAGRYRLERVAPEGDSGEQGVGEEETRGQLFETRTQLETHLLQPHVLRKGARINVLQLTQTRHSQSSQLVQRLLAQKNHDGAHTALELHVLKGVFLVSSFFFNFIKLF